MQREVAGIVTKPLSIIFEKSWRSGDIPDDWKRVNITLLFSKAFDSFPQLPPRQTGKLKTGWVVCEMSGKLANRSHSEGCDQWLLLRLPGCHKWDPPGIDTGPHTAQHLQK